MNSKDCNCIACIRREGRQAPVGTGREELKLVTNYPTLERAIKAAQELVP